MRFFVKRWGVDPIGVQGGGTVWIGYTGNPAVNPWELPHDVEVMLRRMFYRESRWHTVPLNTRADLERIKEALEILAKCSRRYDLVWRG